MSNEIQFKRLVIIAYRLPFKFIKTKNEYKAVQNTGGLVSAILSLSENFKTNNNENNKISWAGTADKMSENISSEILKNDYFNIIPVYLNPKLDENYYGGFCNDFLWPAFHYFTSYSVFNNQYYSAYIKANSIFCEEIIKIYQPGDFLWVHDYQLMMLPDMIRKRIPDATIGFFLHIPFPSFEIFRLMPRSWRESIVKGILGADLVGFHTHDYTQHFIKSVKRTTGYECRQNIIYTPNRIVKADAFPIGIDYNKFHDNCNNKSVKKKKEKIRKILSGQKLIFSVDRLDYSKGLLQKLQGYETFLELFPEWHSKVVFNMVVVPSRDSIEKYQEMKKEIESIIGRLNGKYSSLAWRPVIYQYKSLSFNELITLYDLSDVGLITPLRDGMNLVAKEYVACQSENNGVLILSEMAGAAAELNEALIINPFDIVEMANAVKTALEMDDDEKQSRLGRMKNRISNYNVFTWAFDFFEQSNGIKKQQEHMSVKYINDAIITQISSDYKKAGRRILFLDYDGTLVSFTKYPEMAVIDEKTLQIIRKLTDDKRNKVVIISGRDKDFLEKQFHNIPVSLVAEHGFFMKNAGEEWTSIMTTDTEWKSVVKPILIEYVNRCNGTFMEEKTGSLAWHYRNADSDFAQLRLNDLKDDLADIIRYKTDFTILEGNKVLEVKSGKYDKGQAAVLLITDSQYDFILAAGDDKTDEFLFEVMPHNAYTIRVGLSPSFARYNVSIYSDLLTLLGKLTS